MSISTSRYDTQAGAIALGGRNISEAIARFSASGSHLVIEGNGSLRLKPTTNVQFGADVTTALLAGAGVASASTALVASGAGGNFLQWYLKTTATTGDTRALYARLYAAPASAQSAGVSNDGLRGYVSVTTAYAANAHGAHLTAGLSGAAAKISGLGAGVRATLDLANTTTAQGSVYGAVIETLSAANTQTATEYALLLLRSIANGANGVGTKPNMLAVIGDTEGAVTSGSGDTTLHKTGNTFTCAGGLRVKVNGTVVWIPVGAISSAG
jgi:hypothetical protein